MVIDFVVVIIAIALWWSGLFAVLSGIGLLVRRALGLPVRGIEPWILSFWSGWVFAILMLQLWHLWLKINALALVCIVTLGTAGLLWNKRDLWQVIRACLMRKSLLLIILPLLALWIANRAVGPIQNGDTGLYHMTAVKWAASYPIVPGLGNLHGRLAFNSSFFLYAAVLGMCPWVQKSHYLANGLIVLVLLSPLILSFRKVILGCSSFRSYHIFNSLLLGPAFTQIFNPHLSSLTPDIMIFSLSIVLSSQLYFLFLGCKDICVNHSINALYISILCTGGITIKLSFLPFGVTTLVVIAAIWFWQYHQHKQPRTKVLLCITFLNVFFLSLWVIRGIILSGYVAFPSILGSVPVAWRVPRPLALSEANWIRSWARAPGIFWTEVLSNWNWLGPWLKNFPYEYAKPLIIALLACVLYLLTMTRILTNSPERKHIHLSILIPPFISIIFWFFSAPDVRFSGAYFWILGAGLTALAVTRIGLDCSRIGKILECIVCLSFFIYMVPQPKPLFVQPNETSSPFYSIPNPEYTTISINNVSILNMPKNTDQCWNIPLPCTPYYRPNLHLRTNNLNSGFVLDNTFTFADMHQGSIPKGIVVSPGIGIALVGNTWYDFEEEKNLRWIRIPGKLLVYTERDTHVKLSVKPVIMNVHGGFGYEGQLKISLNNSSNTVVPLKSGIIAEAVLRLRPDFNIITLAVVPPHGVPNEIYGDRDVTPFQNVAFHSIELTSIAWLE